jgi:hypothetical protein
MAKAQPAEPSPAPLWGPDDLPRMAEQIERQASQIESMDKLLVGAVERLNRTEAAMTLLDPERVNLPAELTRSLKLPEIYTATIQGAMMSMFIAHPDWLKNEKYLRSQIEKIIDVADTTISVICDRHGLKGKVEVKS